MEPNKKVMTSGPIGRPKVGMKEISSLTTPKGLARMMECQDGSNLYLLGQVFVTKAEYDNAINMQRAINKDEEVVDKTAGQYNQAQEGEPLTFGESKQPKRLQEKMDPNSSGKIMARFKVDFEEASKDNHDIQSAQEETIAKYKKDYPFLENSIENYLSSLEKPKAIEEAVEMTIDQIDQNVDKVAKIAEKNEIVVKENKQMKTQANKIKALVEAIELTTGKKVMLKESTEIVKDDKGVTAGVNEKETLKEEMTTGDMAVAEGGKTNLKESFRSGSDVVGKTLFSDDEQYTFYFNDDYIEVVSIVSGKVVTSCSYDNAEAPINEKVEPVLTEAKDVEKSKEESFEVSVDAPILGNIMPKSVITEINNYVDETLREIDKATSELRAIKKNLTSMAGATDESFSAKTQRIAFLLKQLSRIQKYVSNTVSANKFDKGLLDMIFAQKELQNEVK